MQNIRNYLIDEKIIQIINIIENAKHEIRFVGGCVRDALIDKTVKDIDLSTTMKPEEVISILNKNNINAIPTGIKYGTITAVIDSTKFEITTLRKDIKCFGRDVIVEFTDNWQEDAARRDFTINALYADKNGTIYDYFDGITDLKKRHVKFIGSAEQRIEEDALRILRFFRFTAAYSNIIDQSGIEACHKKANLINQLSGERIHEEMFKILSINNCPKIINEMLNCQILKYILFQESINITNLTNLISITKKLGIEQSPIRNLAIIINSKNSFNYIAKRWIIHNKLIKHLKTILKYDYNFNYPDHKEIKKIYKEIGKEYFLDIFLIAWAKNFDELNFSDNLVQVIKLLDTWQHIDFPLKGQDIIDLGIKPGVQIGHLLKIAKDAWIKSDKDLSKEDLKKIILNSK